MNTKDGAWDMPSVGGLTASGSLSRVSDPWMVAPMPPIGDRLRAKGK